MLNTGTRRIGRRGRARLVPSPALAFASLRAKGNWRFAAPIAGAALVAVLMLVRTSWTPTPDGDPALHLRLIKDIAATHSLPTALPFHPARVGLGGEIEAMFPYSYPPLYHVTAAIGYAIGGLTAVLAINAMAAAVVAFFVARFVARGAPAFVALLAAPATFISPFVQVPFAGVYMEPMMLGFLFAGAWCVYLAIAFRETGYGIAAGLLLGLAMATRQNAMLPVFVIGLLILWHLGERRAWRMPVFRREAPWLVAIVAAAALAAAPSMLYLLQATGTLGYADLSLPGMRTTLGIDPAANAYISSITKPDMSPVEWLGRYQQVLLYSDRWIPMWLAAVPLVLFVAGSIHMHHRGGASRFFARWALLQVLTEMVMFVTLHGNARYIIVSQMLVYSIVPVGGYAVCLQLLRWSRDRGAVRHGTIVGSAAMLAVALYAMLPAGFLRDSYFQSRDRDLRAFRGAEYAEMGAWVNANTPPDALILTPRTYTAELTWERNVTWVTFYGNAWVVDAIKENDARRANLILRKYGVDYVLIADPPGTYIDRMPTAGMRSYLTLAKGDQRYFRLVHATDSAGQYRDVERGLRLYHVEDTP